MTNIIIRNRNIEISEKINPETHKVLTSTLNLLLDGTNDSHIALRERYYSQKRIISELESETEESILINFSEKNVEYNIVVISEIAIGHNRDEIYAQIHNSKVMPGIVYLGKNTVRIITNYSNLVFEERWYNEYLKKEKVTLPVKILRDEEVIRFWDLLNIIRIDLCRLLDYRERNFYIDYKSYKEISNMLRNLYFDTDEKPFNDLIKNVIYLIEDRINV